MKVHDHEVEGLIFDFDGTLADSMWVWEEVDRQFFRKRGIPFDDAAVEEVAVLGFESGSEYVIEHFGLDERPGDIIEEWKTSAIEGYSTQVRLKPGAREYLQRCRAQGMPMAIATSLQRHLLEPCLKNNGVLQLFDTLCICDELHCGGKSNPTVYLEAAACLGVPAQRCAVFEDVVTPARSAKQAGAYVVGVLDPHKQQATEALKATADHFITTWSELL